MASILITVDIEIKPYLRKFLISKSQNKAIPLIFPRRHFYNFSLLTKVTNYASLDVLPVEDRQNVIDFFRPCMCDPNHITIVLPFNNVKNIKSYNYLSMKAKTEFRNEVKTHFNLDFIRFMMTHMNKGLERTMICENFKSLHDISEDELKTDSLYRHSSRLLQDL